MTIQDVIATVRETNGGKFSDSQMIDWLSHIDARIVEEIISEYEDVEWEPYEDASDDLIVPEAYREVYIHYAEAMIYYSNGDMIHYNNAAELYDRAYRDYANYYRRHHMPRTEYITI